MEKSKKNKHRSFYLSEKTQEKLDKICEKHQINYSAAVSLLINKYELH